MTRLPAPVRRLAGALAATLALGFALPAYTQAWRNEPVRHRVLYVPRDKSLAFHLAGPASKIVVAQPDTVAVVATGDDSVYVQGKALGETNLLVYAAGGRLAEVIDVRVGYDPLALQDELAVVFPGEGIRVRPIGQGLLLTGQVSDSAVAARAQALADKYAPGAVTSNLQARAAQEVVLEVRVLEASRSLLHDLGIRLDVHNNSFQFASGSGLTTANTPAGVLTLTGGVGHTTIDAQLQALEERGVVRTLARPNLVALSGEKASFLAGGEFPYPVPQSGNGPGAYTTITIEFRKYGVKVDFKPTVENNGLIRLEVEPEVSKLDYTNAINVNGFTVPGLITRNTQTTVELHDGASLAIGGLYQRDYQNDVQQVPALGKLPVLGALFRSASWQRHETELLILVTPRLVGPGDFAKAETQKQPAGEEPTPAELYLRGEDLTKPLPGEEPVARPTPPQPDARVAP